MQHNTEIDLGDGWQIEIDWSNKDIQLFHEHKNIPGVNPKNEVYYNVNMCKCDIPEKIKEPFSILKKGIKRS